MQIKNTFKNLAKAYFEKVMRPAQAYFEARGLPMAGAGAALGLAIIPPLVALTGTVALLGSFGGFFLVCVAGFAAAPVVLAELSQAGTTKIELTNDANQYISGTKDDIKAVMTAQRNISNLARARDAATDSRQQEELTDKIAATFAAAAEPASRVTVIYDPAAPKATNVPFAFVVPSRTRMTTAQV